MGYRAASSGDGEKLQVSWQRSWELRWVCQMCWQWGREDVVVAMKTKEGRRSCGGPGGKVMRRSRLFAGVSNGGPGLLGAMAAGEK